MDICRCPHCQTTFQVNIPYDNEFWDHSAIDEDGLTLWTCLECHKKGLPMVTREDVHMIGHDRSYRPSNY